MEYKKIYYNIDESDYKVSTIYFDFYFVFALFRLVYILCT